MDTIVLSLKVFAALAFNALIMYVLAWLLTEKLRPVIDRKPFNCRECTAFWLTCIGGVVVSLVMLRRGGVLPTSEARNFGRLMVFGASVLLGLVNYLHVKSKIKINE